MSIDDIRGEFRSARRFSSVFDSIQISRIRDDNFGLNGYHLLNLFEKRRFMTCRFWIWHTIWRSRTYLFLGVSVLIFWYQSATYEREIPAPGYHYPSPPYFPSNSIALSNSFSHGPRYTRHRASSVRYLANEELEYMAQNIRLRR